MDVAKRRVDSIQAMRAIAALLVVVFHAGREAVKRAGAGHVAYAPFFEICDFGVDLFFVISGFIMYYVTFQRPTGAVAARDFMLKRVVRVVPLYWVATTLFILPLFAAPALLNRTGYSLPYLIASYVFVPWQRPGAGVPSLTPIFGVGWTLNYEVLFYVVFAALIALRVQSKILWLSLLFVGLSIAGFWVDPHQAQLFFWTRSSTIEFVLGAVIAAGFCHRQSLQLVPAIVLLLGGLALWIAAGLGWRMHDLVLNARGFAWGAAAGAIMLALTWNNTLARLVSGKPGGVTQLLGNASFSLYLSHLFVLRVLSIVLGKLGIAAWPLPFILVALVATSVVAIAVYRYVEQPLLKLCMWLIDRNARPPLPPQEPRQPGTLAETIAS